MRKFQLAYTALETFMAGDSLDVLFKQNLEQTGTLRIKTEEHDARLARLEQKARQSVDNVQIIRFNSFEKMGAELSFAMAMLNQEGSGIVLTSIQTVEECRVYARTIEKGKATTRLSAEEEQAVQKALQSAKV